MKTGHPSGAHLFFPAGRRRAWFFYLLASLFFSLTGQAAWARTPEIHWASDPVKPGETAMIIGEGFGRSPVVSIRNLNDRQDERHAVSIVQGTDTSLKFQVPGNFLSGQYDVEVKTTDGASNVTLNAPAVYWSRAEIGADGRGLVRVFGRNIARTASAALVLEAADGRHTRLPVSQADLWDGRFTVDSPIPAGLYHANLWNGDGSEAAAPAIADISIQPQPAISQRLITVPARDGKTDDTGRINDALAAMARAGGGTVRLTRGIFLVSQTVSIPSLVTLQGEGEDLTSILLDDKQPAPDVMISGRTDFGISNLSIAAGLHNHIIAGGFDGKQPIADARNIQIDRIRIRANQYYGHLSGEDIKQRLATALRWSSGGPDAIRLSGSNLSVTNSDILSSGRSLYLNSARDSRVAGNKLYNGRYGWYSISVSNNLVFENNAVIGADLQSTGGGINTLFSAGQPLSKNIIFKDNSFTRLMGWDREAMTSDGPGGCYAGPVQSDGPDRLQISSASIDPAKLAQCIGGDVIFLTGQGRGVVKRIAATDETGGIVLEEGVPATDQSTQAVVGPAQENYLIIGNHFEDTGALQFFGTSINHVIADNTFERSDGIFLRGLKYRELQPLIYVQILNNTIASAPIGRRGLIQIRTQPPRDASAPLIIGVVVRNNKLLSNGSIQLLGSDNKGSGLEDILIEGNSIAQSDVGILADQSVSRMLLAGNLFDQVKNKIVDKSQKP